MTVDNLPEDTEYYESADDLILEDDLIETDIRILGWKRKFRIRALDFGQMDKINRESTDEETGLLQHDLFTYLTIVEGVTRPKIKLEQAKKLKKNNGALVQELSDTIWKMGRISKEAWDAYIAELKVKSAIDKGDFSGAVTTAKEKTE